MENSEHLWWIDSAKGIGVILIVLGHLLYDSSHDVLNQIIYSFHVPMFFILAGFVCRHRKGIAEKVKFLRKKAYRLIIPFIIFTLFGVKRIYDAIGSIPNTELIRQIFYIDGKMFFNAPLWFLIVLFEICIVEVLIDAYNQTKILNGLVLLASLGSGYVLYQNGGVESLNYLGFNRMIICLFFFVLGISLKKLFNDAVLLKPISKGFEFSLLILAAVVTYLLAVKINGKVALYSYVLQNYWIFVM